MTYCIPCMELDPDISWSAWCCQRGFRSLRGVRRFCSGLLCHSGHCILPNHSPQRHSSPIIALCTEVKQRNKQKSELCPLSSTIHVSIQKINFHWMNPCECYIMFRQMRPCSSLLVFWTRNKTSSAFIFTVNYFIPSSHKSGRLNFTQNVSAVLVQTTFEKALRLYDKVMPSCPDIFLHLKSPSKCTTKQTAHCGGRVQAEYCSRAVQSENGEMTRLVLFMMSHIRSTPH